MLQRAGNGLPIGSGESLFGGSHLEECETPDLPFASIPTIRPVAGASQHVYLTIGGPQKCQSLESRSECREFGTPPFGR